MFVNKMPLPELNTPQDTLLQVFWIRNKQIRAFETLINIFANGLAINPDISKKINELTNEYLELCLPGTKKSREDSDKDFIKKSADTLKEVTELLSKNYKGNKIKSL